MSLEQSSLPAEELIPIRDLVAQFSGITFDEKKFYFLEKRVQRRMQATNSLTAKEYYRLLSLGNNQEELNNLINAVTTNETYFYRNLPQLESFVEEILPLVCEEKIKNNDFHLRIWSAACSSGDEPYTLGILLREHLPNFSKWKIEIIATDIDTEVLEKARLAVYDPRAIKDVQPQVLRKYFNQIGNRYQVVPLVKELVQFVQLNLLDRRGMRQMSGFDFVFCRNVLIYFDDESRKRVVNGIYDALRPGGFIFLGHSESVGKISAVFKLIKFKKSLSYQK